MILRNYVFYSRFGSSTRRYGRRCYYSIPGSIALQTPVNTGQELSNTIVQSLIKEACVLIDSLNNEAFIGSNELVATGRLLSYRQILQQLGISIPSDCVVGNNISNPGDWECYPNDDWCGRNCNCVFDAGGNRTSFDPIGI